MIPIYSLRSPTPRCFNGRMLCENARRTKPYKIPPHAGKVRQIELQSTLPLRAPPPRCNQDSRTSTTWRVRCNPPPRSELGEVLRGEVGVLEDCVGQVGLLLLLLLGRQVLQPLGVVLQALGVGLQALGVGLEPLGVEREPLGGHAQHLHLQLALGDGGHRAVRLLAQQGGLVLLLEVLVGEAAVVEAAAVAVHLQRSILRGEVRGLVGVFETYVGKAGALEIGWNVAALVQMAGVPGVSREVTALVQTAGLTCNSSFLGSP